jgi:alpha-1,2-mannosyltransferase
MRFLRDADWLDAQRARAYAVILAIGMGIALLYGWLSLAIGHHPGAGSGTGRPGASDFLSFWTAGRLALAGHAGDAWNLALIGRAEHAAVTMPADQVLAFFYPPTFLLLCLPFAVLPYLPAFFAFVAAQTAVLVWLLRRILPASFGLVAVLGFPGLLLNAATGQNGFVSAACLAVPVIWLERRPVLAGVALSGLVVKPHFALCVPVALLAARRWRALFACGGMALGWLVLAWMVLGTEAYRGFLASLPAVRDALENHAEDWAKLQSVFTAVRVFGAPLGFAYAAQIVLAAGVIVVLALLAWRRPGAGAEGAALAAAAVLCTPHVLDYDLAVVGVPLAWLAAQPGWLPWEKSAAGVAFLWPMVGRVVTLAHVPLGPVILLGLFLLVARRSLIAGGSGGSGFAPPGFLPAAAR